MANLYLLRHAKSDWTSGQVTDHDRPLNERGRKSAARMGRLFAKLGMAPERVICSTAMRARETLDVAMEAGGLDWPVQYGPALYMAATQTILGVVRSDAGDCESALLVGHNPGFHSTAMELIKTGAPELVHALDYKYPTGTLCEIEFDDKYLADITPSSGTLKRFVRPSDQTNA